MANKSFLLAITVIFIWLLFIGCGQRLVDFYGPPELTSPYATSSEVTVISPYTAFHNGVDVFGTFEARFQAAAGGVVSRLTKYWNAGTLWQVQVDIDINPVYSLAYGFEPKGISNEANIEPQLNMIVVKLGDRVEAGQLIGRLYFRDDNSHVHFGVRKNGEFIDPMPHFRKDIRDEINAFPPKS